MKKLITKRKGFTLIEIIGVIIILGVILSITVPSISSVINNSYMKTYEVDLESIKKSATEYILSEHVNITPGVQTRIELSDMINAGLINQILDPQTKEVCDGYATVSENSGNYIVNSYLKCGTNYQSDNYNKTDFVLPVITLLGDNPINLNVGETYKDPGVKATDDVDGDITDKIVITGNINPNVPGAYTITYNVADNAGNDAIAVTRTINVVDNLAPTITIETNGNSTYAKSGSTVVRVRDNAVLNNSSLKYHWVSGTAVPTESCFTTTFTNNSTVNTPSSVTGSYYLWILAKDSVGNTAMTSSNVFYLDNTKPVITLNGSSTVTIDKGSVYSDAGATAIDAQSGLNGSITATGSVNPNVIGTYTITYNVSDKVGNAAIPVTRTINVVDVLAPVITITGNSNITINAGTVYSDAGATALDDVDGNVTSKITVTSTLNTSVVGTYTITYTVSDNAGNVASATRTINVIDNIVPIVTFGTNGNSTYAKSRSTTVTASDNETGINTSSLKYLWNTSTTAPTEASFTTAFTNGATLSSPASATGSYYLWILAKDKAGNTTIIKSNVFNLDNIKPTITLTGSSALTINAGTTYTDVGATATDNINGDITNNIVKSGSVNTNTPGVYTLTYNVSDSSGNTATAVTRTVTVVDATAPTVAFGTNGNTTYAKTRSTTVTVSDAYGTVNTSSLKYLWNTSTTAPAEASFTTAFTNGATLSSPASATGSYYLWIIAKDNTGNTTITRTNVFNLDNTAPVITMNGSTSVTINKGSTYTDAGATATDGINGTVSVTSTGSVNPNIVGTYTITYTASDSSGNAAVSLTRTVIVKDVLAPVITLNGTNPVNIDAGTTYTDAGATATDDVDGNVTSKITVTSNVNPSIGGTYTVTYTVKDNANNTATATRTVNVYVTWYQTRTVSSATYYGDYSATSNTTYYCPSGYSSSGSGSSMICYKTSTTSNISTTTYYCPSGYTASGSGSSTTCSKTTAASSTTATKYCENASYSVSGSVCSRTVSCSGCSGQGLTCMNTKCGVGGYENPNWSCGTSTCTATMALHYSCSSGTLNGTNCYSCSSGTLSGTSCVSTASNIATTTYSCPSGYTSSGSGSSMTCSKTDTTSNLSSTSYSCPYGGSLSGTTCYRGYYSCSSGTLSGSSCYGPWSAWSTTPATPSSTLQVNTEKRLSSV